MHVDQLDLYLAEQLEGNWGATQPEVEAAEELELSGRGLDVSMFAGEVGLHDVVKEAYFSESGLEKLILTIARTNIEAVESSLTAHTVGTARIGAQLTHVGTNIFAQAYRKGDDIVVVLEPNQLKGTMKLSIER